MRGTTTRVVIVLVASCAATATFAACSNADLLVGDDSQLAADDGGDALRERDDLDAAPRDGDVADGAADAVTDGPAAACTTKPGAQCVASGAPCKERDPALACAGSGSFCCVTPCPDLVQPPPSFCDGGSAVAKYEPSGCVIGFGCAPLDCAEAGGTCVGLAPGSCPSNRFGPANKYSCGPGIGTGCCLP